MFKKKATQPDLTEKNVSFIEAILYPWISFAEVKRAYEDVLFHHVPALIVSLYPLILQPWMICCRRWRWRAALKTSMALSLEMTAQLAAADVVGSVWRSLPFPPTQSTAPRLHSPAHGTAGPSSGCRSKVRVMFFFLFFFFFTKRTGTNYNSPHKI